MDPPAEQEMGAPQDAVKDSVAQLGVSLPSMVEGVTLPVNEETMAAGARLPEPKKSSPGQGVSAENDEAGQPHQTPKVKTDPDESTSFGISYSYGHRGPT